MFTVRWPKCWQWVDSAWLYWVAFRPWSPWNWTSWIFLIPPASRSRTLPFSGKVNVVWTLMLSKRISWLSSRIEGWCTLQSKRWSNGVTSITQLRNCVMKVLPNIIFFRQSCNKHAQSSVDYASINCKCRAIVQRYETLEDLPKKYNGNRTNDIIGAA